MSTVYRLTLIGFDYFGEPIVLDVTDIAPPMGMAEYLPPEPQPLDLIDKFIQWACFRCRRVFANGDLGPTMVIRSSAIVTAHVVEKIGHTSEAITDESEVAA